MKFKTRAAMETHPDFHLDARLAPVDFCASVDGSCEAVVDSVSVDVAEIPITLVIPFLKRRRGRALLGSIGGFRVTLSPIHLGVRGMGLQARGAVGTEGLSGSVDGKVNCKTEVEMQGKLEGRLGKFNVELAP